MLRNTRVIAFARSAIWGQDNMNTDRLFIILRLAEDNSLRAIFDDFLTDNRAFLMSLAGALAAQRRPDEALTMCDQVLALDPRHTGALKLSASILGDKGDWVPALQRLDVLKNIYGDPGKLFGELQAEIGRAAGAFNEHLSAGRLEDAYKIVKQLSLLVPGAEMFAEKAREIAGALNIPEHEQAAGASRLPQSPPVIAKLEEVVAGAHARGDIEEEIKLRLEIYTSPEDLRRHSALRLDNIELILGRMFAGKMDAPKIALAHELAAAAVRIPQSPGDPADYLMLFDRFYRLSLGATRFDKVFGPPLPARAKPELTFMTAAGKPLEVARLREVFTANKTEATFFTAASEAYFGRYAKAYISTMLKYCDVNCTVIVCISGPKERLAQHVERLGLNDPRVIFCSDDLQGADGVEVYLNSQTEPQRFPGPYYASVGLLALPTLLLHLTAPIFISGVDTVLQRGVRDLLDEHRDKSVVINRMTDNYTMESRCVNSLVLVYPTKEARTFGSFVNNYLGEAFDAQTQPGFFDQLGLLMSTHHLTVNGLEHVIGYFGPYDINNSMFTKENVVGHRDLLAKFRFVNIFSGGVGEKAMEPDEVTVN